MRMRDRHDGGYHGKAGRGAARFLLPAALSLLTSSLAFGGADESRRVTGFSLGGLFPAGAFNRNVSQNGIGLGSSYGWRIGRSPLFAGAELSIHFYGYVHRHEYLSGIPEVRLDVETFNNILQGLFFLRAQPRSGDVRPYVEALAGISYLFTDSAISGHEFPWDEIAYEINFDDLTVSAGIGAGLAFRLGRRRAGGLGHGRRETLLDVKVRYMAGGRAKYLKQGSIVVEGETYHFQADQSATSFITAQVGLSFFY